MGNRKTEEKDTNRLRLGNDITKQYVSPCAQENRYSCLIAHFPHFPTKFLLTPISMKAHREPIDNRISNAAILNVSTSHFKSSSLVTDGTKVSM